ncbi:MAG: hypothetical protein WCH32_02325 [Pseudomonadota bacterium]
MADENEGLTFLNAFAELANRLAADRVVLHSFAYQSESFGRWECEVGRRRVRIRVSWDGKDKYLLVSTAELATGSKERRWALVEEHDLRGRRPNVTQLLATVHAAITAHAGL